VQTRKTSAGKREKMVKGRISFERFWLRVQTLQIRPTLQKRGRGRVTLSAVPGSNAALQAEFRLINWVMLPNGDEIMSGEASARLFQLVMAQYQVTGNNRGNNNFKEALVAILTDPNARTGIITKVSLLDAREFARRLSGLMGDRFRVQTEKEWSCARAQLSGANWTLTETKYEATSSSYGSYVLRQLHNDENLRRGCPPDERCLGSAIRLVREARRPVKGNS